MTDTNIVHHDGPAPFDPTEEPPDWIDHEHLIHDARAHAGAEALGIPIEEAAELIAHAEHQDHHDTIANQAREAARLGILPDNISDLDPIVQLRWGTGTHRAKRAVELGYHDLDQFLAIPEPEYDWLIPGLLERGDRVIITGVEGTGKSTLLRQIGVQVAAGIHPFTLEEMAPKRVLLIDVENPERLVRRALRPLRISAGDHLLPGFFIPITWSEGIDLRQADDVQRLANVIAELGVDLLITGPSYKMASGDPTAEETAKTVAVALDRLRTEFDFSLILEAHQPYAASGTTKRAERPYGASLWSRWPEFGLHIAPEGELRHWRGDRDQRDWPKALQRGGKWPWTAVTDARGVTFARILEETRAAGRKLSSRELADALGGAHHTTIMRAIKANQAAYDALIADLELDDE